MQMPLRKKCIRETCIIGITKIEIDFLLWWLEMRAVWDLYGTRWGGMGVVTCSEVSKI